MGLGALLLYVSTLALAGCVEALWSVRGARHAMVSSVEFSYIILDDTYGDSCCSCMSVRQFDSMPVHTRPGGTVRLGWARYERLSKLTRVGVTVSVLYLH